MGRFISEDTYKGQVDNPLSLNRYTYTANNPLRYIDASGNDYTEIGDSLTSSQRRANVFLDEKTRDAYIHIYKTYGPDAVPEEHREIIGMLADPSSMLPGYGGVKIVRSTGKAVITAVKTTKALKGVEKTNPFDLIGRQTKSEMSSKQIKKIAEDMKANGYVGDPVKVFEYNGKQIIIDGHHRVTAAKYAGLTEIPYVKITLDELKNTWKTTPEELIKQVYDAGGR